MEPLDSNHPFLQEPSIFSSRLLNWYSETARDLPWRKTRDPYFIWLSEILLQQTRVEQGLPYYLAYTEKYPTIQALAAAPEDEVLRLWQGLGYYSRARNMIATAQQLVDQENGQFPDTYKHLVKLKGVGPYTAAAIASFAFNEPVAVVDGNVHRVLARIFGQTLQPLSTEGKKWFARTAQHLLDPKNPAGYNQAIMEFGARHCKPRNPDCMFCPFSDACVGKQDPHKYPTKKTKREKITRELNYLIEKDAEGVCLYKRDASNIWKGMYEFKLVSDSMSGLSRFKLDNYRKYISKKHILSHQVLKINFYIIDLLNDRDKKVAKTREKHYFSYQKANDLPKPIVIKEVLDLIQKEHV